MKNRIKAIVPEFINRLDNHLLMNHPLLWSSKFHYLLFFGFLLLVVNSFIFSLISISYRYVPAPEWVQLYSVLSGFLLWGVWVYYQSIMDYGYLRGILRRGHSLGITGIFLSLLLIMALIFHVPYWMLNARIVSTLVEDNGLPLNSTSGYYGSRYDYVQASVDSAYAPSIDDDSLWADYQASYEFLLKKDSLDENNREIARAALDVPVTILSSSESGSFAAKTNNFIAVFENYDVENYVSDTLIVYYNDFADAKFTSYGIDVTKRSIAAFIRRKGEVAKYPIAAYYFFEEQNSRRRAGSFNDIHFALLRQKIYEMNVGEGDSYDYAYNVKTAYDERWNTTTLKLMGFMVVLLTYFAVQLSAIIKYFTVRPFLIAGFTLVLVVLALAFLFGSIFELSERETFLLCFGIPSVAGLVLSYLYRGKLLLRMIFWQWSLLAFPFALIYVAIFLDRYTDWYDADFFFVIVAMLFVATIAGYRQLYRIYSYPLWR